MELPPRIDEICTENTRSRMGERHREDEGRERKRGRRETDGKTRREKWAVSEI